MKKTSENSLFVGNTVKFNTESLNTEHLTYEMSEKDSTKANCVENKILIPDQQTDRSKTFLSIIR